MPPAPGAHLQKLPRWLSRVWSAAAHACVAAALCCAASGCAGPGRAPAARGSAPPPRLAEADAWDADAVEIPLRERGVYRFAEVEIAGEPAGRFLVDTGANRTVIDLGVAGRLGLERLREVRASGVTGWSTHREVRVPGLRLLAPPETPDTPKASGVSGVPGVELGPRTALGLSFARMGPALRGGVGGILGFTDLAAVPFTLSPASGGVGPRLTLHRPAAFRPPVGATRHRLRLLHGLPVVEAELAGAPGSAPVRLDLLLDTGSDGALSLPGSLLRARPGVASVPVSGAGSRRGVGGVGATRETWVRSLRALGLTLRDVPAAFGPPPPGIAARPGRAFGRLGQAVLGQAELTFDAERGWLYVRFAE